MTYYDAMAKAIDSSLDALAAGDDEALAVAIAKMKEIDSIDDEEEE